MGAIVSLDKVLVDIKRARATISHDNSEFIKSSLKVVAYICRHEERTLNRAKLNELWMGQAAKWSQIYRLS